jgi:hypothetical protein
LSYGSKGMRNSERGTRNAYRPAAAVVPHPAFRYGIGGKCW